MPLCTTLCSPRDDSHPEPPSDSALLDLLRHGEQDAATALYKRYADRLLLLAGKRSSERLAVRVDAEDVVQSVFRTFFRRASVGHYELPEGEELWKLFLVIALNKIRKKANFHSAAKRDIGRTQTIGKQQLAGVDTSSEVLRLTVEELIGAMPPEHRGVVSDRIQGYEVAEMAHRHSLSKRTIERILQSFRQQLKGNLEASE
jgi:RNA polymerase sigma-70 factor, ECF subfamily